MAMLERGTQLQYVVSSRLLVELAELSEVSVQFPLRRELQDQVDTCLVVEPDNICIIIVEQNINRITFQLDIDMLVISNIQLVKVPIPLVACAILISYNTLFSKLSYENPPI